MQFLQLLLILGAFAAPELDGRAQGVLANLTPRHRRDADQQKRMRAAEKEGQKHRHLAPLLPTLTLPSIKWPDIPFKNATRDFILARMGMDPRKLSDSSARSMHQEIERMFNTDDLPPFQKLLDGAKQRGMMDPPLAPSFERLQNLVDDVSKERSPSKQNNTNSELLPCLLQKTGCKKEDLTPEKVKSNSHTDTNLQKTQASIEKAVTKLQKDLDMRTAEVVKEIERRAAEMRRQIALEAEELIEAVKYLVTMLADSVTRADEMGEGFVREWYDEAEQRYVGDQKSKPLDDDIEKLNADLKQKNHNAHQDMIASLKEHVQKTREEYGQPENTEMSLDEELGLVDEDQESKKEGDDSESKKQGDDSESNKQGDDSESKKQGNDASDESKNQQDDDSESKTQQGGDSKSDQETSKQDDDQDSKNEDFSEPESETKAKGTFVPFKPHGQQPKEEKKKFPFQRQRHKKNEESTTEDEEEMTKEVQSFGLF